MGIDPSSLTEAQLRLITRADRKKAKLGATAAEALHTETTRTERKIHDQFVSFCRRNKIPYWHSNPTRKSSIRSGLPDFLLLKDGRGVCIEFKIAPGALQPIQTRVIEELRVAGNLVFVVTETEPGTAYKWAIEIIGEFFGINEETS